MVMKKENIIALASPAPPKKQSPDNGRGRSMAVASDDNAPIKLRDQRVGGDMMMTKSLHELRLPFKNSNQLKDA